MVMVPLLLLLARLLPSELQATLSTPPDCLYGSTSRSCWLATSQSLTDAMRQYTDSLFSQPLAASILPSGLKATLHTVAGLPMTAAVWFARGGPRGWRVATSQTITVPSELPEASVCPLGLQAMLCTLLVWPSSAWSSAWPVAISQSLTLLSQLPDASIVPSGLNATLCTTSVWPSNGGPSGLRVATSQSMIV